LNAVLERRYGRLVAERARGLIEVRPGPGGGLFVAEQSPLIRRLHRRIAEISPNAVLRTFYLNLVDYIESESVGESSTFDVMGFHPDTDVRLQTHRDLVEAIRTQDESAQAAVLQRHRTLGR